MSAPNGNGYKTLIAACSLVLGITGLIGSLVISSQNNTDGSQNKIGDRQETHITLSEQEIKDLREFRSKTEATIENIKSG